MFAFTSFHHSLYYISVSSIQCFMFSYLLVSHQIRLPSSRKLALHFKYSKSAQVFQRRAAIRLQSSRFSMSTNGTSNGSKQELDPNQGGDPNKKTYNKQATGEALKTANAHSNDHDLKLYGSCFCPFVHRVWVSNTSSRTLELSGYPLTLLPVYF